MRFAQAFARLVKRRFTDPARQHAAKMRREGKTLKRIKPKAGMADALLQGAGHLERLADLLDELAVPEDA